MNNLWIITACSRPFNLGNIRNSIVTGCINACLTDLRVHWLIVLDAAQAHYGERVVAEVEAANDALNALRASILINTDRRGVAGHQHRNHALEFIPSAPGHMVCHVDDDNFVHPQFLPRIADLIRANPGHGFVYPQQYINGAPRLGASRESCGPCGIDTAMMTCPRSFYDGLQWNWGNYCADGEIYQKIHERHRDRLIFLDECLCYYNALA